MKKYESDNEEFQNDLRDIVIQARTFGYAVAYFTPEETSDVPDTENLEDVMVERGNQFIEWCHVELDHDEDDVAAAETLGIAVLEGQKMQIFEAFDGIGNCVARFYALNMSEAEKMAALTDGVVKVVAVPTQESLASEIMAGPRENLPAKE